MLRGVAPVKGKSSGVGCLGEKEREIIIIIIIIYLSLFPHSIFKKTIFLRRKSVIPHKHCFNTASLCKAQMRRKFLCLIIPYKHCISRCAVWGANEAQNINAVSNCIYNLSQGINYFWLLMMCWWHLSYAVRLICASCNEAVKIPFITVFSSLRLTASPLLRLNGINEAQKNLALSK